MRSYVAVEKEPLLFLHIYWFANISLPQHKPLPILKNTKIPNTENFKLCFFCQWIVELWIFVILKIRDYVRNAVDLLICWFVKAGKFVISKSLKWCFFLPLICWIVNICDCMNNGLCAKRCWFVDLWKLGNLWSPKFWNGVFFCRWSVELWTFVIV